MPAKLVAPVVKLGKQKIIVGTIVDILGTLCSVRLSGQGAVLHGLKYIGSAPSIGAEVFVDYRSGTPVVHTNSENLEAQIAEVRREMAATSNTTIVVPSPSPESTIPTDAVRRFPAQSDDPTVDDDETLGYQATDVWLNASTDEAFICLDAAEGAAVWMSLTVVVEWGEITGNILDQTDLQEALESAADAGSHLHGLARWNGASGQTTFDLPDIWEYVDSVTIDGSEEDPLLYSLSSDGDQIVLDGALYADATVVAHGVIAMV